VSVRRPPDDIPAGPETETVKPSSILQRIRSGADRPSGSVRSRPDAAAEPWADFLSRTRALAAGLAGYGFDAGDRAAVVGAFGADALQGVLSIWAAGGVAVPLAPSLDRLDLQGALRVTRARIVLAVEPGDLDRVLAVRPELPDLELILVFRAGEGDRPSPARTTRDVEASGGYALERDPGLLSGSPPVPAAMLLAASEQGPATRRRDVQDLDQGAAELGQRMSLASPDRLVVSLETTGGVELDAARIALEREAELVFADPSRVGADSFRTVRPTRALLLPDVVVRLEQALESSVAARGVFGRALAAWGLRAAGDAGRAPRRARLAHRWVLRDLREEVLGGCLEEVLCAGAVPPVPRLRALGVPVRPLGGPA
jgi:long-subunit acyl-CoA synthetase (AMP-forming)